MRSVADGDARVKRVPAMASQPDNCAETNSRIWYRALLSREQIAAGHVDLIRRRFAAAVLNASAPGGACLFMTSHDPDAERLREASVDETDVNDDAVFFSPLSITAVPDLIAEFRAEPSEPPLRSRAALLAGDERDWDLLPRSSH